MPSFCGVFCLCSRLALSLSSLAPLVGDEERRRRQRPHRKPRDFPPAVDASERVRRAERVARPARVHPHAELAAARRDRAREPRGVAEPARLLQRLKPPELVLVVMPQEAAASREACWRVCDDGRAAAEEQHQVQKR